MYTSHDYNMYLSFLENLVQKRMKSLREAVWRQEVFDLNEDKAQLKKKNRFECKLKLITIIGCIITTVRGQII